MSEYIIVTHLHLVGGLCSMLSLQSGYRVQIFINPSILGEIRKNMDNILTVIEINMCNSNIYKCHYETGYWCHLVISCKICIESKCKWFSFTI